MEIDRDFLIESDLHHFTAEASILGFPIPLNEWPTRLMVNKIGNGMDFVMVQQSQQFSKFKQLHGCVYITVFND